MKATFARVFLFILALPAAFSGQPDLKARIERVEKGLLPPVLVKGDPGWTIQERMEYYKVPAVSIAVINNFKVEWAKAYGMKDIDTKEPATERTLFQAGSISKPVAAMVALKKVEEGKISLDENINDKLTSWKLPENEFTAKRKVTLANLLSHTAGLTVHGFPGYAIGEKLPTVPQVLDGVEPANTAAVRVNMEPGSKFRYSGGGTTIMQLTLMDIERKPFPQIAKEAVLDILEMTDSTYSQPLPGDRRKIAASGHKRDGRLVEGKIHIYPEMAAAGLWTTPTDLAKFAVEIQLSLIGKSNRVLSRDMTAKMLTPFIDSVGLGFFLDKKGEAIHFQHGGADEGFRAQLTARKEKGYGAVVMVNSDNGQIMDEILRSIAREYQWEEYLPQPHEIVIVDATLLEGYSGRYLINPDRALTVAHEAGKLFATPTAGSRFELFPISPSRFVRKDANIQCEFVKNEAGHIDALRLHPQNSATPAPRISDDTKVPYELLISGRFDEAVKAYRKILSDQPDYVAEAENRLNGLGYSLLSEKKFAEAIAVFKLNVELYPRSSNVYDSLGEAFMLSGDKDLAMRNYKKSSELDPKNANAIKMLKKLEH